MKFSALNVDFDGPKYRFSKFSQNCTGGHERVVGPTPVKVIISPLLVADRHGQQALVMSFSVIFCHIFPPCATSSDGESLTLINININRPILQLQHFRLQFLQRLIVNIGNRLLPKIFNSPKWTPDNENAIT